MSLQDGYDSQSFLFFYNQITNIVQVIKIKGGKYGNYRWRSVNDLIRKPEIIEELGLKSQQKNLNLNLGTIKRSVTNNSLQ